jgi:hypothetical protein
MSKEILQLKPNFHGVGVDFNELFRRWRVGRGPGHEVSALATRFLTLFSEHGVRPANIPRLVPDLRFSDLLEENSLLEALTPRILDSVCALFSVRASWIAGESEAIYEPDYSYKAPTRLLQRVGGLQRDTYNMPLRAISVAKELDKDVGRSQRLELVLVEPVATIDDVTIYRHHPFADGWEWSYSECRIQLKAMVRALGRPVPLYKVSDKQIEQAYGGLLFYRSVLKGPLLTDPSLEDYAMTPSESRRTREPVELPLVLSYMKAHGLETEMERVNF